MLLPFVEGIEHLGQAASSKGNGGEDEEQWEVAAVSQNAARRYTLPLENVGTCPTCVMRVRHGRHILQNTQPTSPLQAFHASLQEAEIIELAFIGEESDRIMLIWIHLLNMLKAIQITLVSVHLLSVFFNELPRWSKPQAFYPQLKRPRQTAEASSTT